MPIPATVSDQTNYLSESEHALSQLSKLEEEAAEESFGVYLKPVDLYTILQIRASKKKLFLPKSLSYKIKEKHKRRIQSSVSVSRPIDISPSNNNISTDKLPDVLRIPMGRVMFNYRYYDNKLHRTQITENYMCPFCDQKCASFKGLECHLLASHDLFNYEFWGDVEDYQVVIVSAKILPSSYDIISEKMNPGEKEFYFCRKPMRRREAKRRNPPANLVALDSDIPDVSSLQISESASQSIAGSSIA